LNPARPDLIIASQNLFEIDPHKIDKTEVLLTMVGGRIVYQAPGLAGQDGNSQTGVKP